ncbi:MAG: AAA family ATPase [Sulfurovum sp.]
MKLIIHKFPPITQRCEIDLSKKLTLFVGHNNSGKTYISQLIWGLEKTKILLSDCIIQDFVDDIKTKNFTIDINKNLLIKLSKLFTEKTSKNIKEVFKKDIECDFELEINTAFFKNISYIPYESNNINIIKRTNSTLLDIELYDSNTELSEINTTIEFYIFIMLRNSFRRHSLFLPSSRLFLPSFYKYIFNTEKDFKDSMYNNLDNITKDNKKFYAPSYTQPVDDLIKKLIFSMDRPLEHNIYLDKLSDIIEGNISVDRAEEIGMGDISYNHKSGENIPMYLSSSMVNQLSTLYLYFKYWYDDNSFLIIDEPEMNLHPSKKIEVMELLMHFASKNKLLMATHSATIAKSLINYMHLFDLKEKNKDTKVFVEENELKMDTDIALSSNDIGIYYFNGKTIIPYKKDNDSDIHFGTFTEVEKLQNKQFEYLMDELEDYE